MKIDKMNKDELGVIGTMMEVADDNSVKQMIDVLLGGSDQSSQSPVSQAEKEENTWGELELIHGSPRKVTKAIIDNKWLEDGVINVPYWDEYFAIGKPWCTTKINVDSQFVITRHYISRILEQAREMQKDIRYIEEHLFDNRDYRY